MVEPFKTFNAHTAGMSNSNCCAGRIICLNVEKIVSGWQIEKNATSYLF
jgi:hypothetical protein